ncbi:MAG: hypothetical protein K5776_07270 [Lachnospiraceae bacterium]|nr:hypothetical protein [Lachnospiraceae bacterium]
MKKDTIGIIIFLICVFILYGIVAVPEVIKENSVNKCSICHKNEKMEGMRYCSSCYANAYSKVSSQYNSGTVNTKSSYEKKTSATDSSTGYTSSKQSTSNNYKKESSSSSKKNYKDLEFDPDDYDNPDEYADDAWEVDFDDYDDAYDYWEDY